MHPLRGSVCSLSTTVGVECDANPFFAQIFMTTPFDGYRPTHSLRTRTLRGSVALALYVLCVTCAFAQSSGGTFSITKQSIAGGGGTTQAPPYAAVVSIGQAAAGAQSGGTFRLIGGFHAPAVSAPAPDAVFKDDFEL